MSIYPVRIKKFFSPSDRDEENIRLRGNIHMLLQWTKCSTCGKKVKMRNGWVYHSMPWGAFTEDAWCSKYCLEKR